MALLLLPTASAATPFVRVPSDPFSLLPIRIPSNPNPNPRTPFSSALKRILPLSSSSVRPRFVDAASRLCETEGFAPALDAGSLAVREFVTEEPWAAVRLRVRTFYEFNESYGVEDHRKYLAEREFEALKDRISGKRIGFKRVSCINATLPLSPSLASANELCSVCKFSENGEGRAVVGSLDLNQCLRLADELTGKRPEVSGSNHTRAYLSNVCVAKELQRHGLGYALVAKSKKVAREWGYRKLSQWYYTQVAIESELIFKTCKRISIARRKGITSDATCWYVFEYAAGIGTEKRFYAYSKTYPKSFLRVKYYLEFEAANYRIRVKL